MLAPKHCFDWSLRISLAAVLAACGPSKGADTVDGAGGIVDGAGFVDGGGEFFDAGNCGAQQEDIELINLGDPPDMLIVLDRSGSMILPIDFTDPFGPNRWAVMRAALQAVTERYESNINFGLSVFPTDNLCGVTPGTDVAIGPDNAAPIVSFMNSTSANGNTPAHLALEDASAIYASIPVNPEGRFVLFATDGVPNCGGDPVVEDQASDTETVAAVTALASSGINTFVIGFGDPFALPTSTLNNAALAGGVPRGGGPPHYYEASNAAELEMALETIAGGVITPSCSYELVSLPPEPDNVTVTVDGTAVPRDPNHQNGWDYHPDASTITFFGSYCDMLINGSIGSVAFVYGCRGPVVE